MVPFISPLVSKGYVSPAFGRFLEIGALTAVSAALAYAADRFSGGQLVDYKGLISAVATALLAYLAKASRDASKAAEEAAKTAE